MRALRDSAQGLEIPVEIVVQARKTQHFNIGLGGGVAYWVHDSWTLHTEGQYAWSFGTIDGLNFATINFGAAYHF